MGAGELKLLSYYEVVDEGLSEIRRKVVIPDMDGCGLIANAVN